MLPCTISGRWSVPGSGHGIITRSNINHFDTVCVTPLTTTTWTVHSPGDTEGNLPTIVINEEKGMSGQARLVMFPADSNRNAEIRGARDSPPLFPSCAGTAFLSPLGDSPSFLGGTGTKAFNPAPTISMCSVTTCKSNIDGKTLWWTAFLRS